MISVIIPALNEEENIEATLKSLKNQNFKDFEIIVVDGGSTDNTINVAKKYAKVIFSNKRGIGYQQNFGTKEARGDILLFIQADTILSPNTLREINDLMRKRKDVVGGSINGIFEPVNYKIKIVNKLLVSQKFLKVLYGTCLFVKKEVFEQIGGFKNIINEDLEITFRLKKIGKITILNNCSFKTSSRRLIEEGCFSSILFWAKQFLKIKFGRYMPFKEYSIVR